MHKYIHSSCFNVYLTKFITKSLFQSLQCNIRIRDSNTHCFNNKIELKLKNKEIVYSKTFMVVILFSYPTSFITLL